MPNLATAGEPQNHEEALKYLCAHKKKAAHLGRLEDREIF
jgi:hypothetical protein